MPAAVSRTIAIGDIHGCSTALAKLIEELNPSENDTIVTLGDYIDGGPDSRGVLDQLIALEQRCCLIPLLGNHEEMLLAARESKSEFRYWTRFGGLATLASYGQGATCESIPYAHLSFIRRCRPFHETDRFIFTHANYDPGLLMKEQPEQKLRWEHLNPEKVRPHLSGKTVIVGHTPQVDGEILDLGFVIGIDTSSPVNGWITALEAESGRIVQANQQGEVRETRRKQREIST